MYIFELLTKLFKKNKSSNEYLYKNDTKIMTDDTFENPSECAHIFMPLDSSNEYFACKNCGIVIRANEIKKY